MQKMKGHLDVRTFNDIPPKLQGHAMRTEGHHTDLSGRICIWRRAHYVCQYYVCIQTRFHELATEEHWHWAGGLVLDIGKSPCVL